VERKGIEPSTSALRTQEPSNASDATKELASTHSAACTAACTSEAENANDGTPKTTVADQAGRLDEPLAETLDADLAAVSAAWPKLPPAIRAGILAMIRAASE